MKESTQDGGGSEGAADLQLWDHDLSWRESLNQQCHPGAHYTTPLKHNTHCFSLWQQGKHKLPLMALSMSTAHTIPSLFLYSPNSPFKLKCVKSPFPSSVFHFRFLLHQLYSHKTSHTSIHFVQASIKQLLCARYWEQKEKRLSLPLRELIRFKLHCSKIIWEKMVSLHVIVLVVCLCPNHTMSKDWILVTTVYPQAQAQQWHRLGTQKCFSNLPRFLSIDNTGGCLAK